jgi:hypothetical protein
LGIEVEKKVVYPHDMDRLAGQSDFGYNEKSLGSSTAEPTACVL